MRALCLMLLIAPALAAETPSESFQAFVKAVLSETMTEQQKREAFTRYFDFETWAANRQTETGEQWTAEQTDEMRQEWVTLFLSDEFRQGYAQRNIQIVETPEPAGDKAELVITMSLPDAEKPARFRVLLTRAGDHWRWHSIPRIPEPVVPKTPEQKLADVIAALDDLRAQSQEIGRQIEELEAARRTLESEIAEKTAGKAPYSSPLTTARTLGKAVQVGDAEALLRAHTEPRRTVKVDELKARLKRQSERLASWEPMDSALSQGGVIAAVRVRLNLWTDTGIKSRVLTLTMKRVGDEWLVDEAP